MEPLEMMPTRARITSILKKALLSGEYKSGQELSLTGIASELGVSRTPVREAFQSLAAEGLIELRMNKGAIVKPIDKKFITNHYEMRTLLEGEAIYRAAKRNMEVSDLLAKLYHISDNAEATSYQDYININQELHMAIWKAADNQKLYDFLLGLWNGPSTGKANSEADHHIKSTKEHIEMLQFVQKKNAEKARAVMEQHITRSMENILSSFEQTGEL
ncbi:GntR family transcriptional regulator [Lacrimispora indolis]|nr:GntR family transcriptional regulator [Lacrimispora indolis]MBE7718683.1 GntR family transcriptional regulator [Lacrimispora celerecrescens]